MARLDANSGGCWFCQTDDETETGWKFSSNWDAFYHVDCLKREWLKGQEEAVIIVENELGKEARKEFNLL